MYATLLSLTLVVGADPLSPAQAIPKVEIPRMIDGPAPLQPLSSQAPLVRPALATSTVATQPSLNLPLTKPTIVTTLTTPSLSFGSMPRTTIGTMPIPNGCGSESSFIKPWPVLQTPLGANFGKACDAHDICYGMLGANRFDCDNQFAINLYRACFKGRMTPTCLCLANLYYAGVRLGGSGPYHQAQTQAIFPTLFTSPLMSDKPTTVWDKPNLLGRVDPVPKYSLGVDLRMQMPSSLQTPTTYPSSGRPQTPSPAPRNVQPQPAPSWHPPMSPLSNSPAPAPQHLAQNSAK